MNQNEISKGFQEGLMAARIKVPLCCKSRREEERVIELKKNHSS